MGVSVNAGVGMRDGRGDGIQLARVDLHGAEDGKALGRARFEHGLDC